MDIQGETDFFNLTKKELSSLITENFHLPKFYSQNLFRWIYKREILDFDLMTDISKDFRDKLKAVFKLPEAEIVDKQISSDGTRKYLIKLDNDDLVESVMIKQTNRMTLCVSSQIGCGMGCKFCQTATMGFKRHLKSSEIIRQVNAVIKDAKNYNDTFNNIVFMGMGEPLHNIIQVSNAINVLTDPDAFGFSPRKITVSTVGLVPSILKFSTLINANLAVSLNATTDEVRSSIMPINKAYTISNLIDSLKSYPTNKRKKITIEYVMLSGINDTKGDLARLPELLRGLEVKINLIPYNSNVKLGYETPEEAHVHFWRDSLIKKGLDVTIRWSKGQDIKAACGQLVTQSIKVKTNRSLTSSII